MNGDKNSEPKRIGGPFSVRRLTIGRIIGAFAVAVIADGIQLSLGPLGWGPFDEVVDVIAMVLISWLIGFHILLLPTFIVEVLPVVDMLPTWTACVLTVIALRRRGEHGDGGVGSDSEEDGQKSPPKLPQKENAK